MVIGHGASGALLSYNLINLGNAGLKVGILNKSNEPATGIAYSTKFECHLLNVPAKKMSGLADDDLDFLNYLGEPNMGYEFLPRKTYGEYLKKRFNDAIKLADDKNITLDYISNEAISCCKLENNLFEIKTENDRYYTKNIVLAIGNSNKIPGFFNKPEIKNHPGIILQAWDFDKIYQIKSDNSVCIVGSGLTMIDIVMLLQSNNFNGKIDIISRHGYAPLPHNLESYKYNLDIKWELTSPLKLIKQFKQELKKLDKNIPWQSLIDSIRPYTQKIWQNFSDIQKSQFNRHLRALWDIHRHRIDKKLYDNFENLKQQGTITQHSGGLKNIELYGNKFNITLKTSKITPDIIINTTGLKTEFNSDHSLLVASLLENKLIQPGPLNMGLQVDANYRVNNNIYTIGFPMIGCIWETIAIPDIKFQAKAIAKAIIQF